MFCSFSLVVAVLLLIMLFCVCVFCAQSDGTAGRFSEMRISGKPPVRFRVRFDWISRAQGRLCRFANAGQFASQSARQSGSRQCCE